MGRSGERRSSNHRVLVVEDDDEARVVLGELLESRGYVVAAAANGREALARLQVSVRPDVILLDLWMPVMDGWQLMDALANDPKLSRIPIVIMTAADIGARDVGARAVLRKPVHLDELLSALASIE
jgi:CheY-like chemotaxis protein